MSGGIIYKAVNNENNKIYIGRTSQDIYKRIYQHVSESNKNSNSIFHKSIKKHGKNNFSWEIIDNCETEKELEYKEKLYICKYKSHYIYGYGYNMSFGGENNDSYWKNDSHRKAASDFMKSVWNRENYRSYQSEIQREKTTERFKDIKEREKIGEKTKSLWKQEHYRNKTTKAIRKSFEKEDVKDRKSKASIEMWESSDYRKKQSIAQAGNDRSAKEYVLISPNGTVINIFNLKKFCRNNDLPYNRFTELVNSKRHNYKGWKLYE